MGILGNFLERARERKRKVQELEDNDKIVNGIETKKLSHNERELRKILEAERQKHIKETLIWEDRKRKAEEHLKVRQMNKFTPDLFRNDSILKQKNMFLNGGNF